MGTAYLYGNGGSGGGLNFRVLGGTSAPSSPKPNDIWVNTNTEITSYIFSATEPTNPAEGIVCIFTGASGTVEFNALKKNGIQVYPLSAKQYISDAWVRKEAKSYQNGEWVDWVTYLYNPGDECTDITGGWTVISKRHSASSVSNAPSVTRNNDSLKISCVKDAGGMVYTKNKVPIKGKKQLIMDANVVATSTDIKHLVWRIWSDIGTYHESNTVASLSFLSTNAKDGLHTIDVSALNGNYYVGFTVFGNSNGKITMRSMKLS